MLLLEFGSGVAEIFNFFELFPCKVGVRKKKYFFFRTAQKVNYFFRTAWKGEFRTKSNISATPEPNFTSSTSFEPQFQGADDGEDHGA